MATLLKVVGVTFVAWPAPARWFVVLRFAISVWTALGCHTRIKASGPFCIADSVARTLVVRPAGSRSLASNSKRIACGSRWTLALESTNDVDADGSNSAWAVRVDRKV